MKRNLLLLFGGLVVGSLLGFMILWNGSNSPVNLPVSDKNPLEIKNVIREVSFVTTSGQTITIEDLRGKPVMINFWATWCPPCREEMPLIESVYEQNSSRLNMIGVSVDQSSQDVSRFIDKENITFPIVIDNDQMNLQRKFGVQGFPTTYFINSEGELIATHVGLLEPEMIGDYLKMVGLER